jgi:PAS domain S-box-containing protein
MNKSIIIGLLQNTAILLSFSMIYDYWWIKNDDPKNIVNKIVTGAVIGIIGIILMLTPWILVPGIVFDARSIMLAVSGLFFGGLPTLIAMIITGIFRLSLGGEGMWMGIAVIFISGSIGILWNKFRPLNKSKKYVLELFFMGFVVHLVMLACIIFLPVGTRSDTFKTIAVPVLTIYPAGTILLGILMFRNFKNWQNRKAFEKLQESERRFSELLKNTMLFSTIIDADARIIFCNQSLLSVSGYADGDLIGKNWFEIFIEEKVRNEMKSIFNQLLEGEARFLNLENNIILKNGSKLLVSWNNTILKDVREKVIGVASIGENITKRKQTEEELIRARMKAEESNMLKSIFLANMSHEIRTPMNSIMGFSSLLGEKDIEEADKIQYIDIIRNSGTRLLQLINDIIDLSKLEAKQLTINITECNLHEILNNSIESFRKSELLLKKPGVELKLKIPSDYKKIKFLSDGNRIQQVIDNLITNAIKYTKNGEIETGCSISSENGKEFIVIFVKDTGIGISKEMSNLVFERFRQVEELKFHEGAGLGLTISKGIVDLLGGKIWFTSELNKGTTFYFAIPYISSEEVSAKALKNREVFTQLEGKNIIIAEDDRNSFRYLQLLLRGQKMNILHAENGKVLMDMVKKSQPDLILLDIRMPVMSGFEFLSAMQTEGLNIKIIAQTAYAMPHEKDQCLKAGCHGYISKPIKKAELLKIMNTVLSEN